MEPISAMIDVTGIDFSVLITEVTSLIPQVLPAVFTLLAVRKGISFLMGMVRGA